MPGKAGSAAGRQLAVKSEVKSGASATTKPVTKSEAKAKSGGSAVTQAAVKQEVKSGSGTSAATKPAVKPAMKSAVKSGGSAATIKPEIKSGSGSSAEAETMPPLGQPVLKSSLKSASSASSQQAPKSEVKPGSPTFGRPPLKPAVRLGSSATVQPAESKPQKKVTINTGKPNGNDSGKLKLKPGAVDGRNLLPSKMTIVPGRAPSPPIESDKSNGGSCSPVEPAGAAAAPPKQSKIPAHIMDAHYGNYLQCYLEYALMVQAKQLEERIKLDSMAAKCTKIAMADRQMNKITADNNAINIAANLTLIETIRTAFDNLVDFTGEETLMEIQHILANRHMNLQVEGAVKNEPLFQENELEKVLDAVRTQTSKQDGSKILGLCADYFAKLKKITLGTDDVTSETEEVQNATRILLEECSLIVSAKNAGISVVKVEEEVAAVEEKAAAEEKIASENPAEEVAEPPPTQRLANIKEVSENGNGTMLEDSLAEVVETVVEEKNEGVTESK